MDQMTAVVHLSLDGADLRNARVIWPMIFCLQVVRRCGVRETSWEFGGRRFLRCEHDWTKGLDWPAILVGVAGNDAIGTQVLCDQVRSGVRFYLVRETKREISETTVNACLQRLVDVIKDVKVKEICHLLPMLHTIVKDEARGLIDETVEATLRSSL
jgi:hypothetical protein